MEVPPKNLGQHVLGFKDIQLSKDGKFVRIVFLGLDRKTEIPLQIAADLLFKMMPRLLDVHGEAERNSKVKTSDKSFR